MPLAVMQFMPNLDTFISLTNKATCLSPLSDGSSWWLN